MLALLVAAQTLAVLELRTKLDGPAKKQVDPAYFTDVVRTKALETSPGLTVMTRENVLVLIKASGKTLEQCEGECEVETGRLLGADLIATGDLLQIGTQLKMTLKLHDTHSGRLLSGATASGGNVD